MRTIVIQRTTDGRAAAAALGWTNENQSTIKSFVRSSQHHRIKLSPITVVLLVGLDVTHVGCTDAGRPAKLMIATTFYSPPRDHPRRAVTQRK